MKMNQISLNPTSVTRILGVVACILILAGVGVQLVFYLTEFDRIHRLVKLFSVDLERNIPTVFSIFLLLITFLLLACISALKIKQRDSFMLYWLVLSFGFALMAADEAFSFHERLDTPVRNMLGGNDLGIFYFAWVIPGILLVLVLALFFLRFLLSLPDNTRLTFVMAAILYIGGSIGLELIGGYFVELYGRRNLTYSLIAVFEESLEMAGLIVFIYALLVYLAQNYKEVVFVFEQPIGKK